MDEYEEVKSVLRRELHEDGCRWILLMVVGVIPEVVQNRGRESEEQSFARQVPQWTRSSVFTLTLTLVFSPSSSTATSPPPRSPVKCNVKILECMKVSKTPRHNLQTWIQTPKTTSFPISSTHPSPAKMNPSKLFPTNPRKSKFPLPSSRATWDQANQPF